MKHPLSEDQDEGPHLDEFQSAALYIAKLKQEKGVHHNKLEASCYLSNPTFTCDLSGGPPAVHQPNQNRQPLIGIETRHHFRHILKILCQP
jgi:hypothetical protein